MEALFEWMNIDVWNFMSVFVFVAGVYMRLSFYLVDLFVSSD